MNLNPSQFKQKTYQILKKLVDLREGEVNRVLLMQINIFLIICTLLIVKPIASAFFLTKFGVENLPYAFIIVAVAAALVSTLYSRLLRRMSLIRIFTGTIWLSVFSLLLFGIFLRTNFFESIILYFFYVWVAIFALLATSQFWILANLIFDVREAKRLFGLIGAGAIAGGIAGGYLTSIFANILSSEYLLFLCAVFLLICIPISKYIWSNYVTGVQSPIQITQKKNIFSGHPFYLIRDSKHLTIIACIVGLSVLVAKLVDYQFGGIASSIISDGDELAAFFGFWFSTFNIVSLLFQLFLTRRLVGTLGVGSSLFFLPVMIMVASFVLFAGPGLLFAAVFLKMSDGSLKQSVNKAAMELLILPIPQTIKNQTKTFIDVFVDSAATGLSGLMLIFFVKGLDLSTKWISALIFFFVLIWLSLAYLARKEYINLIRQKILERPSKKKEKKDPFDFEHESVISGLRKVLIAGSKNQIIYVLTKLRELNEGRLFDSMIPLLAHTDSEVRVEVLKNLYYLKNKNLSDRIERMITDPSQNVKIQAFEYLIEHNPQRREILLQKYLNHEEYKIRITAMVSLAIESRNNPEMQIKFSLKDKVMNRMHTVAELSNSEEKTFRLIGLIKCIGYACITELYPELLHFLSDEIPEIRKNAFESIGRTMDDSFIPQLLEALSDHSNKTDAILSLSSYGPGILHFLESKIDDKNTSTDLIGAIPAISRNIVTQHSVDLNFKMLDYNGYELKKEALATLQHLKSTNPHLHFNKKDIIHKIHQEAKLYLETLSILYSQTKSDHLDLAPRIDQSNSDQVLDARKSLIDLLERRLDSNLERIFLLLRLRYPFEDIMPAYKTLKSDEKDMRNSAIEFLDNLLDQKLKKILIPIVESAMVEVISEEAIRQLNLKIPTEMDCFEMLLAGKDDRIKFSVLYLISKLKEKSFEILVTRCYSDDNPKIRDYAKKVLSTLSA